MTAKILTWGICALLLAVSFFNPSFNPSSALAATGEASVESMLGQMLMLGFRGDGQEQQGDIPYLKALIRQGKAGGVILFDMDVERKGQIRNVTGKAQLQALTAELQAAAAIPLFIAVDQEGGKVQRLKPEHGFKKWPEAAQLGETAEEVVRKVAYQMGKELAAAGINLNFAPSLDVNVNPASPAIGAVGRSFSADPTEVARKAKAFMEGLNRAGVIGCFKHFPGHGSALADTHLGAADITASWREYELAPYRELLGMPGAYGVMAAHVFHKGLSSSKPATLSAEIINGLLREGLGWNGVVFSDDMQMGAITGHYTLKEALRLGVDAGVDIFVFGNNLHYRKTVGEEAYAALLQLYREGAISKQRIVTSYERIMRLKQSL